MCRATLSLPLSLQLSGPGGANIRYEMATTYLDAMTSAVSIGNSIHWVGCAVLPCIVRRDIVIIPD